MNHMTGRSCDDCGGPLREFLVPFGEQLPEKAVNAAFIGWSNSQSNNLHFTVSLETNK